MPDLYRRVWDIRVGTIRIAGEGAGAGAGRGEDSLDCSFEVEKSTMREPNTCTLKIWNLSQTHRRALDGATSLSLMIDAGYADQHGVLFSGDVAVAASRRRAREHRSALSRHGSLATSTDIVDVVTEIEAEDGGTSWRNATIRRSFAAGTPVASVLRACAAALELGEGNISEIGSDASLADVSTYTEGTVLSGHAHREMDRIVRSCGLTWSVQDGAVQLRRGRSALATTAVVLAERSGLIGSPSIDTDGYVSAVSLLHSGLYPGRPVVLESRDLSGSYQVRRVRHVGGTAEQDWSSEVTLEER